jgi:hypothetical protein
MNLALRKINYGAMRSLEWATTSMGAFWFLFFLIIVANAINPPKDVQTFLLVLVSEFYQGIALPGLGASQKAEAEETRRLLQETHDYVMQELTEIKETRAAEMEEIKELKEILNLLKSQKEG